LEALLIPESFKDGIVEALFLEVLSVQGTKQMERESKLLGEQLANGRFSDTSSSMWLCAR
jgi:hypothetical protein